jgi:hypothetical protein
MPARTYGETTLRPGLAALRLRPAEWWSFLDTMQVSYLIMLP